MKSVREEQEEEKTCEICGDKSFPDYILTCSQCGDREHFYCSHVPLSKDPDPKDNEALTCEPCRTKNRASLTRNDSKGTRSSGPSNIFRMNRDCRMRVAGSSRSHYYLSRQPNQRGKVKFLPIGEVMRLEKERQKPSSVRIFSSRPHQINHPMSALPLRKMSKKSQIFRLGSSMEVNENSYCRTSWPTKISRDESGSKLHQQATRVLEDRRDDAILVQQATRHVGKELPTEADQRSLDTGAYNSCIKEKSKDWLSPIPTPSGHLHKSRYSPSRHCILSTEPGIADVAPAPDDPVFEFIRDHSRFPSSDASWTGRFILSSNAAVAKYLGPFQAYSPARACRIAYEFSGFIPDDLPVEMISESQLLIHSKIFKRSADFNDIALFFYPDVESYRDYVYLSELMKTEDYAIRGSIVDDIEILIFTSNHLPLHTEWLKTDLFLWGVFYNAKKCPAPRNLPDGISTRDSAPENPGKGHLDDDNEPAGPKDSREEADKDPAAKRERPAGWIPPFTGWVKLNTSAILRGGVAGVGGSVHGPLGKWIFGYILNLGQHNCTQLRADLWALLLGLKLVSDQGYKKVQVETDSEQALECLKTNPDKSNPNADFIVTCRKLLVGAWQISLSLVNRDKNRPAFVVVKHFEGHRVGDRTILDSLPSKLSEVIDNCQVRQLP